MLNDDLNAAGKKFVSRPRTATERRLSAKYDALWRANIGRIRRGEIEIDLVLAARTADQRRGLTLCARPSYSVSRRIAALLARLRRLEPDQYYYAPAEFHVTVLSLFTGTVEYERFFARLNDYIAATDAAVRNASPLHFEFTGVTVSPAAILIQGFFRDDALNLLRDALRRELRARGLAERLDLRYRVAAAHMTVVRFRAPLRNPARFAAALESAREIAFGTSTIATLHLVKNDWYMSRPTIEPIRRYRLRSRLQA